MWKKEDSLFPGNDTAKAIVRTPEAQSLLDDFFDLIYEREKADKKEFGELAYIWARACQHADQLSLIYACACGQRGNITIKGEHMKASISLVIFLTEQRIEKLNEFMTENEIEKRCQRIEQLIKRKGNAGAAKSWLYNNTRAMSKSQRDDAIDTLIQGEIIHRQSIFKNQKPTETFFMGAVNNMWG